MAFALLLALFRLDAEGGGGTQQQAAQADRLAGFLAPAVVAAGQALQRFVDLVEQLLLPLQQAKLPLPLFLAGSQVGLVAGAFEIAQLAEFAFDARLQFLALAQQFPGIGTSVTVPETFTPLFAAAGYAALTLQQYEMSATMNALRSAGR